jgi:acyl carrier protein
MKKGANAMDIQEDIMEYVSQIGRIPRNEMDAGMKIYNSRIISSLRLIELMAYIEKRYSCTINPEELVESNFRDIGTLIEFVRSKVNGRTEGQP